MSLTLLSRLPTTSSFASPKNGSHPNSLIPHTIYSKVITLSIVVATIGTVGLAGVVGSKAPDIPSITSLIN